MNILTFEVLGFIQVHLEVLHFFSLIMHILNSAVNLLNYMVLPFVCGF